MTKKANHIKNIRLREYTEVLADIRKRIQEAQVRATISANKELINLYWSIGKIIAEKQEKKWVGYRSY